MSFSFCFLVHSRALLSTCTLYCVELRLLIFVLEDFDRNIVLVMKLCSFRFLSSVLDQKVVA